MIKYRKIEPPRFIASKIVLTKSRIPSGKDPWDDFWDDFWDEPPRNARRMTKI